jgi:hypothetical protein
LLWMKIIAGVHVLAGHGAIATDLSYLMIHLVATLR